MGEEGMKGREEGWGGEWVKAGRDKDVVKWKDEEKRRWMDDVTVRDQVAEKASG